MFFRSISRRKYALKEISQLDLITFDWHNDVGGTCDCNEDILKRLDLNNQKEVALYAWAGLPQLNDGQIAPAIWLNIVGDVYVLYKQGEPTWRSQKDRYGKIHNIFYSNTISGLYRQWISQDNRRKIIWDIDMDFFTKKNGHPDQKYTPIISNRSIANFLSPKRRWLQLLLANLEGITIALEPEYTGGLSNSLHLFAQWEKALFQRPVFSKNCKWNSFLGQK